MVKPLLALCCVVLRYLLSLVKTRLLFYYLCAVSLFFSVSPVFFSTGEDGMSVSGLSKIPDGEKSTGRPIIFVGNHQLLALDLGVIVER